MGTGPGRALVAGLAMAILAAAPAAADIYRWMDHEGTLHHASGLERVPEQFRKTAERMPASPGPAVPSMAVPPGTSRIAFTPGSTILVTARIGGAGPITLILDTGADRTLVSPDALGALGIPIEAVGRAQIKGVAGSTEADLVWIPSLEVDAARIGPLRVVALDAGIDADGLLGRDFLDRFRVTIDAQAGTVTLAPLP